MDRFLAKRKLPIELQMRIQKFLAYQLDPAQAGGRFVNPKFFVRLSPGLRKEVKSKQRSTWAVSL